MAFYVGKLLGFSKNMVLSFFGSNTSRLRKRNNGFTLLGFSLLWVRSSLLRVAVHRLLFSSVLHLLLRFCSFYCSRALYEYFHPLGIGMMLCSRFVKPIRRCGSHLQT